MLTCSPTWGTRLEERQYIHTSRDDPHCRALSARLNGLLKGRCLRGAGMRPGLGGAKAWHAGHKPDRGFRSADKLLV